MSAERSAPATPLSAARPRAAGTAATLGGRIKHAVGRRAARLRTALLAFSLLLPAILTGLFGRPG